jgi:small-conductance mechanosensitive channel
MDQFLENLPLEFLSESIWGNTIQSYFVAILIFVGVLIFIKIVKNRLFKILSNWAKKTKTDFDDEIIDIVNSIPDYLYLFVSLFIGFQFLTVHSTVEKTFDVILIILVIFWATKAIGGIIEFSLYKIAQAKGSEIKRGEKNMAYFALSLLAKLVLWTIGFLLILSNLGFDITALVASLGIGGIAVALAVQNILGDVFSSFSLYLDKPFEVDDFIIVGEDMGVVKKIGLKSTRIQALQGEEIVISNNELTSARIQNYKKMQKRRVQFAFGVMYSTPLSKLKKIQKIIKDLMKDIKLITYDRAHFKSFGASSLDCEVVYYIDTNDYNKYMDKQQEINLAILKAFEKEGIEMAFPTRTVHLFNETKED